MSLQDNRLGKHSTWIVLDNPPRRSLRELLAVRHIDDGRANGGHASLYVPTGTYAYSAYSVDGEVDGSGARSRTPEHRMGGGEVTVP